MNHQQRQADRAQQVYDLIRDCPGVGLSDIARGLGITVSMVNNSLIYMERLGFEVTMPPSKQALDRAEEVYGVIVDCPGVIVSDIARGLGLTPSQIRNSLVVLKHIDRHVSEDEQRRFYPFEPLSIDDALELISV